MNDLLEIYEVKASDTLSKIGSGIGMTGDEVRDFHNANCEQHGMMYFNSLIGIEKIILPKNHKSAAQIKKENTDAVPAKILSPEFYAETYEVVESYESDFENKLEINYTLDIKLTKIEENQVKRFRRIRSLL